MEKLEYFHVDEHNGLNLWKFWKLLKGKAST